MSLASGWGTEAPPRDGNSCSGEMRDALLQPQHGADFSVGNSAPLDESDRGNAAASPRQGGLASEPTAAPRSASPCLAEEGTLASGGGEAAAEAPLIFSLLRPYEVGGDPVPRAEAKSLVSELEEQARKWIDTIGAASKRVVSAPSVNTGAVVEELPLAELHFWHRRTKQLEPLSKQAETAFMKNVNKVLDAAGSEVGVKLRKAFAALRRLYIEAHWNAKYLKILEKPFTTLAEGDLRAVSVALPGMVRTLKMVAQSSRFYSSLDRVEALMDRVTLALCVRVASFGDPGVLVANQAEAIEIMETIESVLGQWQKNVLPATDSITASTRNNGSTTRDASLGARRSSWNDMNFERILERPSYIRERCTELRVLFVKLAKIRKEIKVHSCKLSKERKESMLKTSRSITASLLKAAAKRAHPRVGILSTAAEGIFEPRCQGRWKQAYKSLGQKCDELLLECQEIREAKSGANSKTHPAPAVKNDPCESPETET